jgi:hypothetical protein
MVPDIPLARHAPACRFLGAIYKYCKYPNAAKEYLRFIMEREQHEPWQRASIGYISHTLRAYDCNPVWTDDPQHMFFRDIALGARHAGYAARNAPPREHPGDRSTVKAFDVYALYWLARMDAKESEERLGCYPCDQQDGAGR